MRDDGTGERSLALFLLGLAAFTPPLLKIFSTDAAWLGVPVLYLYVFVAWAGLIVLMGISAARGGERPPPTPAAPTPGADDRE
jgi:hypothetical protein